MWPFGSTSSMRQSTMVALELKPNADMSTFDLSGSASMMRSPFDIGSSSWRSVGGTGASSQRVSFVRRLNSSKAGEKVFRFDIQAITPLPTKVVFQTDVPLGFLYQTGVPLLSKTTAYGLLPSMEVMFPVKYQPPTGAPGFVTLSGGKSCGRHRIQY